MDILRFLLSSSRQILGIEVLISVRYKIQYLSTHFAFAKHRSPKSRLENTIANYNITIIIIKLSIIMQVFA